jgi:hypothetical protein
MSYDDFHSESEKDYNTLSTMSFSQKVYSITFLIWNIINLIGILYLIYTIIKIGKPRRNKTIIK